MRILTIDMDCFFAATKLNVGLFLILTNENNTEILRIFEKKGDKQRY
jgi:hypothetical protein